MAPSTKREEDILRAVNSVFGSVSGLKTWLNKETQNQISCEGRLGEDQGVTFERSVGRAVYKIRTTRQIYVTSNDLFRLGLH
jgi:hypothetical protein